MPLRPAIFFDRDGTLIEDRGHLSDPLEVEFISCTFEALRRLQDKYLFFVVTNQPGVAEGTISLADVERVNSHVVSKLAEAGLKISAVYVCPHCREDYCDCIKPKPYVLQKASKDFQLNLQQSFVVGDHPHDVKLAEHSGAQGIYVCTGHGLKHLSELRGVEVIVPDILAGADWILSRHEDL
jgi:histidinol-phosphate phosphatase family protein